MSYVLPKDGQWKNISIPTKTTTAYVEGEWVYNDGTNDIPATTTSERLRGIVREAKASASNTNPIVIAVPVSVDATVEMDVSGTLTAAMVGTSFDLASSTTVNQAASTYSPLTLVKFISATKGQFALNYDLGVEES